MSQGLGEMEEHVHSTKGWGEGQRPFLIIIAALALMLATMHHNFLGARAPIVEGVSSNIALVVHQQLDLAKGRYAQSAPIDQSRILVPIIFYGLYHMAPWSWEAPTFLLAEWLVTFASLLFMYLLARKILGSAVSAMAAVLLMVLYVPFGFSGVTRVGEAALFGIYCAIVLAALEGNRTLFVLAIVVGSLQRADVSLCAAFFGVAHFIALDRNRAVVRSGLSLLPLLIPLTVLTLVKSAYNLAEMSEFSDGLAQRLRWNLKDTRILLMAYAPLLVLPFLFKIRFDLLIRRMLIFSIAPWLCLNTFLGNFSETRRFFPVLVVVIIGMVQALMKMPHVMAWQDTSQAAIDEQDIGLPMSAERLGRNSVLAGCGKSPPASFSHRSVAHRTAQSTIPSSLAAALLDGLFALPAGYSDASTTREMIAAYCVKTEFFRSLLESPVGVHMPPIAVKPSNLSGS